MKDKKNLMLIVPMLHSGGFERVCITTARLLEPYFNIYIVIFSSADIAYDIRGLNVIDIKMGTDPNPIKKVWNVIRRSRKVKQLKKELDIDIAYSFGPTANLVNSFSAGKEETWTGIRGYLDLMDAKKIRLFCRKSDKVVCCAKAIEVEIREKHHCENICTVYNPVDIEMIQTKAEEGKADVRLPWSEAELKTGYSYAGMGREDDIKGFWHLIKAFSLVYKKHPEAKLLIIGEGDFLDYKKLALDLGVDDAVYFTGLQKNPFAYLKQIDIFVLSSFTEGFPNVLIEAMALGLPVIATDCKTGPAEILYGGNGIMIPDMGSDKNFDPNLITDKERILAEKMEWLSGHPKEQERYGQLARKRAAEFSNERYAETLLELAGVPVNEK